MRTPSPRPDIQRNDFAPQRPHTDDAALYGVTRDVSYNESVVAGSFESLKPGAIFFYLPVEQAFQADWPAIAGLYDPICARTA
jgi:hypothetical protein